MKKIFLFLLITITCANAQSNKLDSVYLKAKIATFYSSTVLNSFHELNLAISLTDSLLNKLEKTSINYRKDSLNYKSLINELNTSKSIALDNLNYRIPSYSVITNNRSDLNIIDDANELLIEDLIEEHLNQADPILKGKINENTHFFLINIRPFDDTLLGVVLDYFSATSGHYAIRPHELNSIIGKSGYERYVSNNLGSDDYNLILNNYKIDKLYNITLEDKGSILDGLFYWGATLNTITKEKPFKAFQKYFEDFKKDKREPFQSGLRNFILSILLLFLLLRVFDVKIFKRLSLKSFLQKDFILNDLILIFLAIVSFVACFYLGNLFSPAVNAFHNEPKANLWVIFQIIGFPIISFSILLLGSLKFSKLPTISLENIRKIIYCSISVPFIFIVIINQFSSWYPNQDFMEPLILLLLLIIPSHYLGISILHILKKDKSFKYFLSLIIGLLLFFISQFNFLIQNYLLSNVILFCLSIILISIHLLLKTKKNKYFEVNSLDFASKISLKTIRSGFNYESYEKILDSFFSKDFDQLLFIKGVNGVGKKLILDDYLNSQMINSFELDFSNSQKEYYPFTNCFIEKNQTLGLEDNFFTSPISFDKIYKGIGAVSSLLPIDLPSLEVNSSDDVNVIELSIDLLNTISDKIESKCVLVIRNLESIDKDNELLLNEILTRLSNKSSLNAFRIIILQDSQCEIEHLDYLFDSFKGKTQDVLVFCNDINIASKDFFDQVNCSNDLFEYLMSKIFEIKDEKSFSIGNLILFFEQLIDKGFIEVDSDKFYLKNNPPHNYELNDNFNSLVEKFSSLNEADKTILQAACLIGFDFDINLLSSILKTDTLRLINDLFELEKKLFIKDNKSSESLFQFESMSFYNWIKIDQLKTYSSYKSQKVFEIQSRIIKCINQDINIIQPLIVKLLTDDLIKSKYTVSSNQDFKLFLLNVSELMAENNFLNALPIYLNKYVSLVSNLEGEDYQSKILSILNSLLDKAGSLSILDDLDYSKLNILEFLISEFLKSQSFMSQKIFFEIVLKDFSSRWYLLKDKESISFNRYQVIKDKIKLGEFKSSRIDYYLTKIDNNLSPNNLFISKLLNISNECFKAKDFQFYSEILRELSIEYRKLNMPDEMISVITESLMYLDNLEYGEKIKIHSIDDILNLVKKILGLNLSKLQLTNLSYSLNRYLDAYSLKNEHDNLIIISNYNIEINKKIKDSQGLIHSYRHKGKSLFKLGRYNESLDVYSEYFNFISNDIITFDDFKEIDGLNPSNVSVNNNIFSFEDKITPVLEGVLHNCIALNNYDVFEKIKIFLNSNNVIISHKVINNKLFWIDDSLFLKDLLPVITSKVSPDNFSNLLMKAFLLISFSDENLDIEEVYDSVQYVNAIQCSIDKNIEYEIDQFEVVKNNVLKISTEERIEEFKNVCSIIHEKYSTEAYLKFYNALIRIIYSDLKIYDEEIKYLTIAKSVIINE